MESIIKPQGYVFIEVKDLITGKIIKLEQCNTVVSGGKALLAKALAQDINSPFDYYIDKMVFGTGGESANIPKTVDSGRPTLYNEILSVGISSSYDISSPTRAIFTGAISSSEGNNFTINEAGLVTSSGDLFSMITFSGLSKTSQLQFTLNWHIVFA